MAEKAENRSQAQQKRRRRERAEIDLNLRASAPNFADRPAREHVLIAGEKEKYDNQLLIQQSEDRKVLSLAQGPKDSLLMRSLTRFRNPNDALLLMHPDQTTAANHVFPELLQ